MFPSSGYFRAVHCPFFASGLCERTHCHFRHSKPPEEKNKDAGPSYSTSVGSYSPAQSSSYSSLSQPSSSFGPIESYSTAHATSSAGPGIESYSTFKEPSSSSSDQQVIPSFLEKQVELPKSDHVDEVDRQSLPKISGLAKRRKSALPSYKPTPKSQISYGPSHSEIPKYSPTPKTSRSKSSSLEYDPVKNYTFWPNGSNEDEPGAGIMNGEHDSTEAAAFSEEEADENGTLSEKDKFIDSRSGLEDISNRGTESHTPETLPDYVGLLTPSSYFTSKMSGLSEEQRKDNKSSRSSTDDSSSKRKSVCDSEDHHRTSTKSSHSSKSYSHHHSSSSSSSKVSTSHSKKFSSSSHAESSGKSKLKHSSSTHKQHSLSSDDERPKNAQNRSSSHHDHSSSTGEKHSSSSKHKHSSKSPSARSIDDSSKNTKTLSSTESSDRKSLKSPTSSSSHSSKYSSSSTSKDPSSVSKHSSTSKPLSSKDPSSLSKHSSSTSKPSSSSSSKRSSEESHHRRSSSEKSKNHRDSSSKHTSFKPCDTISKDSNDKQSEKVGKGSDIKPNKEKLKGQILKMCSNSDDHPSHKSSTKRRLSLSQHSSTAEKSDLSIKRERSDSKEMTNGIRSKHSSTESSKGSSQTKRSLSSQQVEKDSHRKSKKPRTINSDLFGEESSGSDSDCQIVEPAPEPPPTVYELTDSDEDYSAPATADDEEEDAGFSDHDTFDECLRIFQESEQQLKLKQVKLEKEKPELNKARSSRTEDGDTETAADYQGKKRMAHQGADKVVRPLKTTNSSRPRLSPAEVMHNRIVEIQKKALLRAAQREGRESDLPKEVRKTMDRSSNQHASLSVSASTLISNQKKREAHLPITPTKQSMTEKKGTATFSPNSFYRKKSDAQPMSNGVSTSRTSVNNSQQRSADGNTLVTIAGTASKTEKRKAHTPTQMNLKRPILPVEFNAKVNTNIRQRYLNLIIDEFFKFCGEEESIAKAQEDEAAVYKKASNKNMYLHGCVNAIKRIRALAAESQPSSSKQAKTSTYSLSSAAALPSHICQSHEATLGGPGALRTSFTLHRSRNLTAKLPVDFKGEELYKRLKRYILTEEQLRENGFPRSADDKSSKAVFYKDYPSDKLIKDNERICRRCGKRYLVDDEGHPYSPEQCVYHYGNAYKKKVAGSIDSRYACCNERAGVQGCQVAKTHVNDGNKFNNLTGYMKTMQASESDPRNLKVLSLDCEMVYTKTGLELARVTVIGEDHNVVYESLVKPDSAIIDYNTRFSGITEKDMRGVTTTLRDVQAIMLSIATDKTILMGHSLESDLTALKVIHGTVVDTSIVFPHRLGLPYKRALKNVMRELLQKIIQADDGGHDSKEDAIACMQLMLYKVKEEAKRDYRCN